MEEGGRVTGNSQQLGWIYCPSDECIILHYLLGDIDYTDTLLLEIALDPLQGKAPGAPGAEVPIFRQ